MNVYNTTHYKISLGNNSFFNSEQSLRKVYYKYYPPTIMSNIQRRQFPFTHVTCTFKVFALNKCVYFCVPRVHL